MWWQQPLALSVGINTQLVFLSTNTRVIWVFVGKHMLKTGNIIDLLTHYDEKEGMIARKL